MGKNNKFIIGHIKQHFPVLLLFLSLLFFSCNKYNKEKYIQRLEEKFWKTRKNVERQYLAKELHHAYSIYHLKQPGDTSFLRNWAKLAKEGNRLEQEKYCYTKYLKSHSSADVYRKRGVVNVKLAYYSEASKDFYQAAGLSTGKKQEEDLKNARYYEMIQTHLAHINTLLEKGAPEEKHRLQRAEIFLENGKPNYAKYEADYLLQKDSTLADCYYILARLNIETKQYEKAYALVEKYLALEDKLDKQKIDQARNLKIKLEARLRAKKLKRRYLDNPEKAALLAEIGKQYFYLSEYAEANKYFTKYIAARPDSASGFVYRGQCYLQAGKLENALYDFNMALKKEPSNISARNLKGYAFLLQKDTLKARKEIEIIQSYNGTIIDILKGIK